MNIPASNPYGLDALLNQGDPVALTVLLILLLMSVSSWAVILTRLMVQWRLFGQARIAQGALQDAGSAVKLAASLKQAHAFAALAQAGLQAMQQHGVPCQQLCLDEPGLRSTYQADLLLLRPDLHVAWRGDQLPTGEALQRLVARVTGQQLVSAEQR